MSAIRHAGSRRQFLAQSSALAVSSLLSFPEPALAEPPPETTTLKIFGGGSIVTCIAPLYAAQRQLLHSEGFTEVRYLEYPGDSQSWPPDVLLSGEADISLSFPPTDLIRIDTGAPVVILAGSHIGCVELVGGDRVRTTPD